MSHLKIPVLPTRPPDSHKGTFGHAFLIGGATGMTGAIAIAGMACLRAGAGLVTLGIPACNQALVASLDPNSMTLALPNDSQGRLGFNAAEKISELLRRANCVAIGPGLGRSQYSDAIVADLFSMHPGMLIVDADGLNAFEGHAKQLLQTSAATVITPHEKEFARLTGQFLAAEFYFFSFF